MPLHLHEVNETSSGFSEGEGNQTNHISGRLAVPGQLSEYPTQPNGVCQALISNIGSDHQRQETQMEPVQEIVFLGLTVSTVAMQVSLPKEKMAHVQQEARQLHSKVETSVQKVAAFVGMT